MTLVPARRLSGACAVLVLAAILTACNDDPADEADPRPSPAASSTGPSTEASPDVTEVVEPSPSGNADVDCLVAGSPWQVSTTDLESQFASVLAGIDVIDVAISGGQTLTVTPALVATFTPNRVTRVRVDLGDGLTMVMVQRQTGSATGRWEAGEGKLTSSEPWTGNLHAETTVTINGRSGGAPLDLPVGGLSDVPVTFSCESGTLMMTAEGSPFSYLFR